MLVYTCNSFKKFNEYTLACMHDMSCGTYMCIDCDFAAHCSGWGWSHVTVNLDDVGGSEDSKLDDNPASVCVLKSRCSKE